jgi:hypothetical protein
MPASGRAFWPQKLSNMKKLIFLPAGLLLLASACQKDDSPATGAQLGFQFKFDTNQERLNNIGLPSTIPTGNAAQTPDFRAMSVHYIELAPGAFTPLGSGAIVYKGTETTKGGENAVDFDKAEVKDEGQLFAKINLKDVSPGTYEWVRASVTYQNYDVKFNIRNVPALGDLMQQKGTIASFVGFNTYLTSIKPNTKTLAVNDDKKQGFWAFETQLTAPYDIYNDLFSGEAPLARRRSSTHWLLHRPFRRGRALSPGNLPNRSSSPATKPKTCS